MENRLKKYGLLSTKEDEMQLDEIINEIKEAKGIMLGISILTQDNKLKNIFFTNNYQKLDILPSLKDIKNQAVEELEKSEIEETQTENVSD